MNRRDLYKIYAALAGIWIIATFIVVINQRTIGQLERDLHTARLQKIEADAKRQDAEQNLEHVEAELEECNRR